MQSLRHARSLVRLVLAWVVLSIGVAVASPIVKPQTLELICSGSGVMKIVVQTDDGSTRPSAHTLDCSLCANIASPPPMARASAEPAHPLSYALRPTVEAHLAWATAAPLPARGPPANS